MSSQRFHRVAVFTCSLLVIAVIAPTIAQAQVVVARPNYYQRSPYWSVGMIYAQADMIRAQGEAAVDYQTARQIAADAYDKELDNSLKAVEIYFQRRAVRDAEVLKVHLDEADKRKEKALRRLQDHPELTGAGLINGNALNTLKEALRPSVLSFNYLNDDPDVESLIARFQLTPELLKKINLRLTNVSGDSGTFSADTGQLSTFQWWPYLLRDEKFKVERDQIDDKLQAIRTMASNQTEIEPTAIKELVNAILSLANKFLREVDGQEMAQKGVSDYLVYRESEMHLQSLTHAIQRVKHVGRADGALVVNGYNPNVDGKNLASLLTFMVRNGVEFAPPEPGIEGAYHQLFEMSKGLYIATTDGN